MRPSKGPTFFSVAFTVWPASPLLSGEFHVDCCCVPADLCVLALQLAADEPTLKRAVLVDDEDIITMLELWGNPTQRLPFESPI